jgi:hypothetical protein
VTSVSDPQLGVAKLLTRGSTCEIEYRRSVEQTNVEIRRVRRGGLRRAELPANTRCLWLEQGEWRQGWTAGSSTVYGWSGR